MTTMVRVAITAALLAGLALTAKRVAARAHSALTGRAETVASEPCFNWDFQNPGVENNCNDILFYQMAVIWDSPAPPTKTLSVTARQSAANQVTCSYVTIRADGTVAQAENFPAFTIGNYSTVTRTPTIVPPGAVTVVGCRIAGNGTGRVLKLDYFQP